jgi:hypothetical protein
MMISMIVNIVHFLWSNCFLLVFEPSVVTVLIFSAGFPTYAQGAFPFDFLSSPCFHCRRDFPVAKFTSAADSFLLRRSQSSIRCLRSCLVRAQNRASLGSSSADLGAGQVSVCGPAVQVPISSGRSRFCSESVFSCVPRPGPVDFEADSDSCANLFSRSRFLWRRVGLPRGRLSAGRSVAKVFPASFRSSQRAA